MQMTRLSPIYEINKMYQQLMTVGLNDDAELIDDVTLTYHDRNRHEVQYIFSKGTDVHDLWQYLESLNTRYSFAMSDKLNRLYGNNDLKKLVENEIYNSLLTSSTIPREIAGMNMLGYLEFFTFEEIRNMFSGWSLVDVHLYRDGGFYFHVNDTALSAEEIRCFLLPVDTKVLNNSFDKQTCKNKDSYIASFKYLMSRLTY